jgi:amino acid permease
MKKAKRIAALIGIILIASMYLISFISAFFATEAAPGLFLASVFVTIVIPIMIYGFQLVYRLTHKNEDFLDDDENDMTNNTENLENSEDIDNLNSSGNSENSENSK